MAASKSQYGLKNRSSKYPKIAVNVFVTAATTENLSRHEMLEWVNDCLQSQFSKIEQLHTGAAYCLLLEVIFPGLIPLKKVKWNSRNELDWLSNWKLVSTAFKEVQVERMIPVDKLVKGKFQDNFEFLKWFKKFFDANYVDREYNPVEMRGNEPLPIDPKPGPAAVSSASSLKKASNSSLNRPNPSALTRMIPARPTVHVTRKPLAPFNATTGYTTPSLVLRSAVSPSSQLLDAGSENTSNDNALQIARKELEEAKTQIAALKCERDLSISKLRAIEVMCKTGEATGNLDVNKVLGVIYETEQAFAVSTDDDADQNIDFEEAMDVTDGSILDLVPVPYIQHASDGHTDRNTQHNITLMLNIHNLQVNHADLSNNHVDLSSVDNFVRKITRSSMSINKSKIRKGSFTSNVAERMNKKAFTNSLNRVSQISQLSSQPTVYMEPRIEPSPASPLRGVENALNEPVITSNEPNTPTTPSQHAVFKKPVMELSPTFLLGQIRDNLASSLIMPDGRLIPSEVRFMPMQRIVKKL